MFWIKILLLINTVRPKENVNDNDKTDNVISNIDDDDDINYDGNNDHHTLTRDNDILFFPSMFWFVFSQHFKVLEDSQFEERFLEETQVHVIPPPSPLEKKRQKAHQNDI